MAMYPYSMSLGRMCTVMLLAACLLLGLATRDAESQVAAKGDSEMMHFPYPPDTRPAGCGTEDYNDMNFDNMTVSIVIPWLAEKWLHLRDTLEAILHFTPDHLIEEIIYVSDGNEDSKEKELTAMSSKVKVIAFKERQGLIRAKMRGVQEAKAPVLMFMEAHCIVNRNWLQPLLHRLVLHPKALAMPSLDFISQTDWTSYTRAPAFHWRYEWNMNLVNSNPGGVIKDGPKPYISPGTSGGIFAMKREWFLHLGLFDVGMLEWGGDHFELTMKVWRCGGRIEIVPCARIGHLFRDPEHRPYEVEINQVVLNYKRLAEVWLKDHLPYFYRMKPEAVGMKLDSMEEVHKQHADLKCKSMKWYLENVDHEMNWEMDKICHPYVNGKYKCKGKLAEGRFTVTNKDLISRDEYIKRRKGVGEKKKKLAEAKKLAEEAFIKMKSLGGIFSEVSQEEL
mmetsp:Transcript_37438/g.67759  ORF Transcript_37438/g.67759 Transcript_37438/m.67759 type:complete len:450 (+) Transcript_37438:53-1402(+)